MLGSPHGARAADLGAGNLLRVLGEARFIYERLLLQLDDGGIAIFGWAALSALGWWRTRSAGLRAAWLRIAGALLIALPLFLVMSRLRSGYPFSPRYGTPYTGLAFALLVVGLDAFPAVLRPLQQRLEKRSAMTAAALPLLALSVQIAIPLAELMARPAALRLDGQGGMRATFESIKALGRPTLVAASPCWAEMVPRYYWKYSGNRAAGVPFEVVRPSGRQGCLAGAMDEHNRGLFHRFLTRHPDGLILLYQQHAPCAVAPDRIQRRAAAVAAYQEWHPVVHGGNDLNACLWVIAHAEDEEEVRSIARQARFPPPINLAR